MSGSHTRAVSCGSQLEMGTGLGRAQAALPIISQARAGLACVGFTLVIPTLPLCALSRHAMRVQTQSAGVSFMGSVYCVCGQDAAYGLVLNSTAEAEALGQVLGQHLLPLTEPESATSLVPLRFTCLAMQVGPVWVL